MSKKSTLSVAIVGAGISGLFLAEKLMEAGVEVQIFEKSRGAGGRVATRRLGDGVAIDHGAQFITAETVAFRKVIEGWIDQGVMAEWACRIAAYDSGQLVPVVLDKPLYVGTPTMTSIAKLLARKIRVSYETKVANLKKGHHQSELFDDKGNSLGKFDWVVSTAPPAQTLELFPREFSGAADLKSVFFLPCWAVMLNLSKKIECEWDAIFAPNETVSWMARNSSKPGRKSDTETWVLHCSPAWSKSHLESEKEVVFQNGMGGFKKVTGHQGVEVNHSEIHRWRYSLVSTPIAKEYLMDSHLKLAACGDWCGGNKVESAFLSAQSLVEGILEFGI